MDTRVIERTERVFEMLPLAALVARLTLFKKTVELP